MYLILYCLVSGFRLQVTLICLQSSQASPVCFSSVLEIPSLILSCQLHVGVVILPTITIKCKAVSCPRSGQEYENRKKSECDVSSYLSKCRGHLEWNKSKGCVRSSTQYSHRKISPHLSRKASYSPSTREKILSWGAAIEVLCSNLL